MYGSSAPRPDLAALDINMPVLGGFAVAKEIQRLLPQIPILLFTLNAGEQFVSEARKAGVQGFVSKDRRDDLIRAVEQLLRSETFF